MEQLLPPAASSSTLCHNRPPSPQISVEAEVKKVTASVQQAKDERSELEVENSALRKKLIQQKDTYNYDIEVITQVCSRSPPGLNPLVALLTPPLIPLPLILPLTFLLCILRSFPLSISLCLDTLFYNRACPPQSLLP